MAEKQHHTSSAWVGLQSIDLEMLLVLVETAGFCGIHDQR